MKQDSPCSRCRGKRETTASYCRACWREYGREYGRKRRADPTMRLKMLDAKRKQAYGITTADFKERLLAQNGVCAVCLKPETVKRAGRIRALAVDHDHKTGEIRGLLCNRCNRALGNVQDDPRLLRQMVSYLEPSSQDG